MEHTPSISLDNIKRMVDMVCYDVFQIGNSDEIKTIYTYIIEENFKFIKSRMDEYVSLKNRAATLRYDYDEKKKDHVKFKQDYAFVEESYQDIRASYMKFILLREEVYRTRKLLEVDLDELFVEELEQEIEERISKLQQPMDNLKIRCDELNKMIMEIEDMMDKLKNDILTVIERVDMLKGIETIYDEAMFYMEKLERLS
jgi:hypothetical protein